MVQVRHDEPNLAAEHITRSENEVEYALSLPSIAKRRICEAVAAAER